MKWPHFQQAYHLAGWKTVIAVLPIAFGGSEPPWIDEKTDRLRTPDTLLGSGRDVESSAGDRLLEVIDARSEKWQQFILDTWVTLLGFSGEVTRDALEGDLRDGRENEIHSEAVGGGVYEPSV